MMIKTCVVIAFFVVACNADAPVTPPQPIRCGYIPNNLYKCLGNPQVVKHDVAVQCKEHVSECERFKCIFRKSGWMEGDKIKKDKIIEYFDQFGRDHAVWSEEVEQMKGLCLGEVLPSQGVHLNCPPYDVMMCALTSFVKNANASQWSSSSECEYPRQFAASCPLCPNDCFAPMIPTGSCNACILLPRSP